MVNYREKLDINFDLSDTQIEVLKKLDDTIVRAIPGSGKTTILTLKIKNLLLDDVGINQVCCMSYTNVSVEDLEKSCAKKIPDCYFDKINFLTFHKFCLEYVLNPFSYLYGDNKGFKPYKKIFNYKEYGNNLLEYLNKQGTPEKDINIIRDKENIFYNFEFQNNKWVPESNNIETNTVIKYLNFLKEYKLIDFNLINLFTLFIIEKNKLVRRALNKSIDWIFIDEFQDVSAIQCKIIEAIRKDRKDKRELKWFLVGDPNQSIYGFAGANPRSMYDIKKFFTDLNGNNCEVKLDKTYRCSSNVFNFSRKNYNNMLVKIKDSISTKSIVNSDIMDYMDDLIISENVTCDNHDGDVVLKNTLTSIAEILNLKFSELIEDEVCCIGINKYNSIDVYRQYKLQVETNDKEDFSIYSELYKDYEDKYGFKYFSLFTRYLLLKNDFYNNRLRFHSSINKYLYLLKQLVVDKISEEEINDEKLFEILVASCDLPNKLDPIRNISVEFKNFSQRLIIVMKKCFANNENSFINISDEDYIKELFDIKEPTIEGFINFAMNLNKEKISFEIKHIHKIKGLEYDQVIVQRIEDLPYKPNMNKIHQLIFYNKENEPDIKDVYDYIQDLNKLYVMLTRAKKNLYIIVNSNKPPQLIDIELQNIIGSK